jgi:transcriptional regulator NrdR family protein
MTCEHPKSRVVETRKVHDETFRRRECSCCGVRFSTVEKIHDGPIPRPGQMLRRRKLKQQRLEAARPRQGPKSAFEIMASVL